MPLHDTVPLVSFSVSLSHWLNDLTFKEITSELLDLGSPPISAILGILILEI